ncbi:Abi family protein [Roseomonas sp. WA12]
MLITDDARALSCLERSGYYRLSGYWYPFRESTPVPRADGEVDVVVHDQFRNDTTFEQVHNLYVFDKRLRMLFMDAIERVEVGLRVAVALRLGARTPWAHRDASELHPNFSRVPPTPGSVSAHQDWLNNQDRLARRSSEDFVSHFRAKYSDSLPIWIAIELWDFGLLSKLLGGMKHADLSVIAGQYGLPRRDLLTTWVRSISHVRNICAHHGRLWNRALSDQPKLPRLGEVPLLDHIASNQPTTSQLKLAQTRVYAAACAIQYFLRYINPATTWAHRLSEHLDTFPGEPGNCVSLDQMGFPTDWTTLPLWN